MNNSLINKRAELMEARTDLHRRDALRLARHQSVLEALKKDGAAARKLISEGEAVVTVWEKNGTCHPSYIVFWRSVLAGNLGALERAIDTGDWAVMKNTPFKRDGEL